MNTLIINKSEISEKFESFVNEVICRRASCQRKAVTLWEEIRHVLPEKTAKSFEIEWSHYMLSEFKPNTFGKMIEDLKQYF